MYAPHTGRIAIQKAIFGRDVDQSLAGITLSGEKYHALRIEIGTAIATRAHEFPMVIQLFSGESIVFDSIDPFLLQEELMVLIHQYTFEFHDDLKIVFQAIKRQAAATLKASLLIQ